MAALDLAARAALRSAGLPLGPAQGPWAPSARHLRAPLCVRAQSEDGAARASTTTAEPKWKQKLAAAEQHAEETRQATLRMQEEYRRRQEQERRQVGAGGASSGAITLESLALVPYLTDEGKIADCSQPGAKATVYAIFNESKNLQYVGVSRQVYQSMRLHFARFPALCHWVKVHHFTRPSRSELEMIRESWIAESGGAVPGNDGGETQYRWENALDCKPLMTEEERAKVEEAAPGPPTAKALKEVARRVERELEVEFKRRNCSDVLRFDPKLKDSGLLDLKSTAYAPDMSVPQEKPKDAK